MPDAYERLLLDAINGDASLFALDAVVRKVAYDLTRWYPRQAKKLWHCIDSTWIAELAEGASPLARGARVRLQAFLRSDPPDYATCPEGHEEALKMDDESSRIRA